MADRTDHGGRPGLSLDVAVSVDFDPGTWLAGPTDGDAEAWTAGALAAVCADFAIADGSAEQRALREVLHAFAAADLGSEFRFLRLRSLAEAPIVAVLHVWPADPDDVDPAQQGAAVLSEFEPGTRWYDAEPQVVVVDEGTGLRRAVRYALGEDGRLSSVIRYHRRVVRPAADVVLGSAGADLRTTALALADLDDLARAVRLADPREVGR
ncbi:hypothetical protein [Blastococcus sp. TF02A-35]|uniref:hypothetical protein n=1 Tax=Blastococcus sp. TF02A-35 TaxID=2559612 RepID=UPI0010732E28|nr:hypothetical protein [Blastococcus sp. TF02A_35]TFV53400.1 hypothetical protein E4P43_02355 [Blastococcus sp. TF02A_35]